MVTAKEKEEDRIIEEQQRNIQKVSSGGKGEREKYKNERNEQGKQV